MNRGAASRPPPRIVGRYALYEPLGKGGAAAVFLSIERGDHPSIVAVKLLHETHARDSASVSRLLDEVRLSKLVQHRNVVRVRDFVSDGTEMLTVMDYVHGEPLSRLLVATGSRSNVAPPIAVSIIVDLLHGLHAAHEARDVDGTALHIVHRDVTPENVLVGDDGVAHITDFGVAKAEGRLHKTRDGGVRGKLMYLAPEQVGGEVTARTDVYAAGLVLWEMLAGMRPIDGETEAELVTKALDPKIARPSTRASGLSKALDDIVMRAIAPDPEARFTSALEMAQALVATGEIAPTELVAGWVQSLAGQTLAARSAAITAMLDAERAAEIATAIGPSRAVAVVPAAGAERTLPTLASAGVGAEPAASTRLMTVTRPGHPSGPVPLPPPPPTASNRSTHPGEPLATIAVAPMIAPPMEPEPSSTSASTRLLTGLAIGLGAAFVGAGIAIAVRSPDPPPPPVGRDAGVIVTPSAVPSVVPTAVPTTTGSTTLALDASVDDAAAAGAAATESAAPPPSETASARTKPPHGGKGAPPPTKCDPPWLIDSKGIRRYNPACIR